MSSILKKKEPGALVLESRGIAEPKVFMGSLFGARYTANQLIENCEKRKDDKGFGEIVFNTSLAGYQEILSDPSYYGEIVTFTAAHIGNTGVNSFDSESRKIWAAGLVVQDWNEDPSSWRAKLSIGEWLSSQGIPGIFDVDTRALTRLLRSQGVVRGIILPKSELEFASEILKRLPNFEGRDLISEVTTKSAYYWEVEKEKADLEAGGPKTWPGLTTQIGEKKKRVAVLDFGVKWNMLRILSDLGCEVKVFPASTRSSEILAYRPNGVFLSNGPGDPSAADYAVETVKELLGKVPIFGVCMGHQILSLALGARTYKLKFGHRGGNQPVMDLKTRRVEISAHNHGYSVDAKSLPASAAVSHINLNDQTVEGIEILERKAFSVQYHPEACPGPHDSLGLFQRFMDLMQHQDREPHVPEISRTGS